MSLFFTILSIAFAAMCCIFFVAHDYTALAGCFVAHSLCAMRADLLGIKASLAKGGKK